MTALDPFHAEHGLRIYNGNSLEVMPRLEADSFHAIVTDPPYGLGFMGREWDHDVPGTPFWTEALRVAKPGAHLFAFGGTRKFHRMACAIEDAGWEIRDCVSWLYGEGFPKSLDVAKDLDRRAGHWRVRASAEVSKNASMAGPNYGRTDKGEPISDAAKEWQGWGTALKPAWEPIIMARKPFKGTVAESLLRDGTGAINVDASRIPVDPADPVNEAVWTSRPSQVRPGTVGFVTSNSDGERRSAKPPPGGRWPANVAHDGSAEVLELMPDDAGAVAPVHRRGADKFSNAYGDFKGNEDEAGSSFHGDLGSAARFFYCAKPGRGERGDWNLHPTVKPLALMRWLVRMVTPPGGTVLDPFMGSGSTLAACQTLGFDAVGIELSAEYCAMAVRRLTQPILPFGSLPG